MESQKRNAALVDLLKPDLLDRNLYFLQGAVDPNGVVTAATGTRYWDNVADILYVNESAAPSGNAWQPVGGSTSATGTGANTQVAFWTGATTLAGDAGLTYDAATDTLSLANSLHIDQASASGAMPVLRLDQGDVDDSFIDYIGTSAASAANSISTWTTGNNIQGHFRVEINGVTRWMRFYDAPTS